MALIDFDWRNPRYLPRRKAAGRDVESLARLHAKRVKHKCGKAHATGKRKALIAQRKAKESKAKIAERKTHFDAYKQAVRAFWVGACDEHPATQW